MSETFGYLFFALVSVLFRRKSVIAVGTSLLILKKSLLISTSFFLFFTVSSLFISEFALFLKRINNNLKKYKCNSKNIKGKKGLLRLFRAKASGGQIQSLWDSFVWKIIRAVDKQTIFDELAVAKKAKQNFRHLRCPRFEIKFCCYCHFPVFLHTCCIQLAYKSVYLGLEWCKIGQKNPRFGSFFRHFFEV